MRNNMTDLDLLREEVAKELALKDGRDWDKLPPVLHRAYIHNAYLVVEERQAQAQEEGEANVSDSGTEQLDQPIGGGVASEPPKPRKRVPRKRPRA